MRHGEPCTPDASTSPRPGAISAYRMSAFLSTGRTVCSTKLISGSSSGITSTLICASACGTLAARRASTARRVYSDAHTCDTAAQKSSGSAGPLLGTLSYRPAPLMPSRSSTLAEERAIVATPAGSMLATSFTSPADGFTDCTSSISSPHSGSSSAMEALSTLAISSSKRPCVQHGNQLATGSVSPQIWRTAARKWLLHQVGQSNGDSCH
mmetsp:Transcript_44653/g.114161  ORF Transcript_44653/g.114161 Transcript_44653/m.114161 type:complete len:210 (-) Transcript_44653:678-1307(-)